MRLSQYFLPLLKEEPKEAQIVSHRTMLRAGLIKQQAAGIYSWLPMGLKVLRKLEAIVNDELQKVGCLPLLMPTLQPTELWKESGRYEALGITPYAAAKGGVKMLMETMAQELADQKIRVNAIAPGAIKTPINTAAWDTPAAARKLLKLIPYGRIGEVEDLAARAVWLASDAADYVVGTTLFVDGGMSLYPAFREGG